MPVSKAGQFAAEITAAEQENETPDGEPMVDTLCGSVFTASAVVRSPGGDRGLCKDCLQLAGETDDSDAGDWRD